MMKTYSAKPSEIEKKWIVIDADGWWSAGWPRHRHAAARQAQADYTPHMDCGDHVVVINADKVKLTGRKLEQKIYYWHTGYPGGIKERTAGEILDGKHPGAHHREGRRAHAAARPAGPPASDPSARLCRRRASARGAAAAR